MESTAVPLATGRRDAAAGWAAPLSACVVLMACSPALNWRDVRPEGTALQLQMPCRPNLQARTVELGAQSVRLQLLVCDAAGMTWALAHATLTDATGVDAALQALRAAAFANIGAAATAARPLPVAGATAQAAAGRFTVQGRLPDGQPVQMQLGVFADGLRVHQVTVLGPAVADADADTYFNSLRIVR